ncbi:MAG: efflux RND transporter periplasmic adaptor subunit [Acidobacteriaceae bacterium]|nr:efflux RND transporter periplasmic adaptor subunit [Acidobacteriaceae bacterium]
MKKYWLLLVLPVLLILWWGLNHRQSSVQVHFATARQARIESAVSTNGKVEPVQWAAARAETAGVVQSILTERGTTVKAGQTLVTLDTTAAQADLAAAQARLQEAQAEVATLGQGGKASQISSLTASVTSAQTAVSVAQRNYETMQRLAAQQAATRLQVQDAKDVLERAKQQLAAFQDQRRTLVTASDKTVAQARVQDAQAAVASAQRRVALGSIRSPIAGTVYQFDLKVGAYLQLGDQVALVGNIDQVKVTVYVDEPDLGRVGEKMPVMITWDARPGQKWWGEVDKLPTQVVALGTRTVGEVTTVVNNPHHDLLPGVTVNATITSKVVNDALSIPKAALRNIRGTSGVYKLNGSSLAWTPIGTGISDVNNVQVLTGLQRGDKVADRVVEPSDAEIKDGLRVKAAID